MCDDGLSMDGDLPVTEASTEQKKNLSQRRLEARRKLEQRKEQAMLRQQLGDDYDDLLDLD